MVHRETAIHLVAGGVAGTVGAVVTCPLEVVKTRLQSSKGVSQVPFPPPPNPPSGNQGSSGPRQHGFKIGSYQESHWSYRKAMGAMLPNYNEMRILNAYNCQVQQCARSGNVATLPGPLPPPRRSTPTPRLTLIQCLRLIVNTEGPAALFKGLGPNIVGVAPSRAIYFCTYSQAKALANQYLPPDTPIVHLTAASAAGFMSCTCTNPIWFVKTRLQLDGKHVTALACIKRIYAQNGILGFYKGITASYMGISETVVHFVLYEGVKARLIAARSGRDSDQKGARDFAEFMAAGAFSKTVASCIAYPHEVARTRLREEGSKYRKFWQTLHVVWTEEGYRGWYRGLATQLVRQIPNTAIMMSTYEAIVYILTTHFNAQAQYLENT